MNISIQQAEIVDSAAIVRMSDIAFKDDPIIKTMLPAELTADQQQEWEEFQIKRHIERASQANRHYFKAIDERTGQIVGISGWWKGLEDDNTQPPEPPTWINKEGLEEIGQAFKATKQKFVAGRKDLWYVQTMVVHPDYQGQGIGAALMKHGLEMVDKDDMECYLESAPSAIRLYQRHGFEVKEAIYLGSGLHLTTAMFRPRNIQ